MVQNSIYDFHRMIYHNIYTSNFIIFKLSSANEDLIIDEDKHEKPWHDIK